MRGTRGARGGARQGRRLGLAAAAAALAVLAAGCAPSGAAEEGTSPARDEAVATGTSTETTDAPASAGAEDPGGADLPVPTVLVLGTPPGFEDVMPAELTDQWAEIVTGAECVLAGRAGAETDAVDDMRAASTLEEATDVDLTTQGAGEGNEAQHVLTLVSADWQTGDSAVRGLSRVGNLVLHDGSLVSQWLELTFTCTGELDEEAWTAVIDDVRPVMAVDGEGWDGLTPDDL